MSYPSTRDIGTIKMNEPPVVAEYVHKIHSILDIQEKEAFMVFYLNRKYNLIGWKLIGLGTDTEAPVDVKEIFGIAMACKARYMVLSHNHPSEDLNPSHADKALTRKIGTVGKSLACEVLDHVIIGPERPSLNNKYYSFVNEGDELTIE